MGKSVSTYTFEQTYSWGHNWDGNIIGIPDDSVFYRMNVYINSCDESIDEWYIFVKKEDFDINNTLDKGCCQVGYYLFEEWVILHLNGIIVKGDNWKSASNEELESFLQKNFNDLYVYEYKQSEWVEKENVKDDIPFIDRFVKVADERLIACYKITGLAADSKFYYTEVRIKDKYNGTDEDVRVIKNALIEMYYIEENWDEDEYVMNQSANGNKLVVSKDKKLFNDTLNEVFKSLKA